MWVLFFLSDLSNSVFVLEVGKSPWNLWTGPQLILLSSKVLSPSSLFPSDVGADIDCEDNNGNTPLHIAARYGHELLINTLITNGADTAK